MNIAIVVAAGKGTRLGSREPKQFLELSGTPIIIHTLRNFEQCDTINEVILVLPAEMTAGFLSTANKFGLRKVTHVVAGGETRARSVLNGLNRISDAGIVAVHDGVRPFVTAAEVMRVVQAAEKDGAALLVAPVADTIKETSGGIVVRTPPRLDLRRALTPQAFRFEILRRAFDQLDEIEAAGIEITDESLLVERLGVPVTTVEGSARNIKITSQEDLVLGEAILAQKLEAGSQNE